MNYEDESYVRAYTRKTITNRRLKWFGRAVLQAMLVGEEFDRAGVFAYTGDPAECISIVTELPIEIVRDGLAKLVETQTWIITPEAVVWPTYHHAQTCARSDRERQALSRERRAAEAAKGKAPTTPKRRASRPVTGRHAPSRAVTPSDAPSHGVTPSLAVHNPTLLDPDRARDGEPEQSAPATPAIVAKRTWVSYPEGWREWSAETLAEAAREGLTATDLAEHVEYWTTHEWRNPCNNLDRELRRQIPSIKLRLSLTRSNAAAASPAATSDPYAWRPNQAAREYCDAHELDLGLAARAYREGGLPAKLGSLPADDDFMRRLKCWCATGEFIPSGPLPKPPKRAPAAEQRGAA